MIKKSIHLSIIVMFLIAVCIWEEIAVNNYLEMIDDYASDLQTIVLNVTNIDSEEILLTVENMNVIWKQKENTFCVILNHQQVEVIGVEIARLKASIVNNDKKEFILGLSAIRFYVDNLSHIIGLSVQNLI